MLDDHPATTFPAAVIDAYAQRELTLLDLQRVSPTSTVVVFELAGEPLHMLIDDAAPSSLVLERGERYRLVGPDAVACGFALANELHERLLHVRFVFEHDDDSVALVRVRFTAPLLGADLPRACRDAFDVGVDALWHAASRWEDGLTAIGCGDPSERAATLTVGA